MEYRYYNHLIKLRNDYPIIFYWVSFKIMLISYTITQEISLFILIQLLINGYILVPHYQLYEAFYLILDLAAGFIGIQNNNLSNLSYLIGYISFIPIILLGIIGSLLMITHSDVRYQNRTQDYQKKNNNLEKIKSKNITKYNCPICYDDCLEIGYHVCLNNHYFHKECITKWFNNNEFTSSCPVCRQ